MKNLLKCQEMMTIYNRSFVTRFFVPYKYYKLVSIDLSRQTNSSIPQQINFIGKLEEDDGATSFFNC